MPPQISQNLAAALSNLGAYIGRLEGRIVKLERGSRTAQIGNATIDSGQLTVTDDDGNQVLSVGLQPDGTYAVAATGSTAPDAPSAPTLTTGILELLAAWDGEMDDGSTPLADFACVQVHCSAVAGFTPDGSTLQGTMLGQGTFRVGGLAPATVYWVALVAVNASGNLSDPSEYASGQPQPVVSAISAGSLTAEQMGLPGGILNGNPWFAGGYGGDWSATSGTFTVVPASSAPAGVAYGNIGRYVNNGAAAGWMGESGGIFTVTPGASYLVTAWVNSSSGAAALGIAWTLAGTYVSPSTVAITVAAGVWTQVQAVVTAPGGGVDGGYPVAGTQTGDGSTVYAVAIIAQQSIPGGIIQTGTITADQIAAGTIAAGIVNGTTIEGAQFIAYGSEGAILAYSGPPATGDLVLSISATAGTDTDGNAIQVGVASYGASGSYSLLAGALIEMQNGVAGLGAALQVSDAAVLAVTGDAEVSMQITIPLSAALFPSQPGNYAAAETWHYLGSAGSTGCTLEVARYRMTVEGECEIDIALVVGSGGTSPGTYTWSNALGSDYQFAGDYLRIYQLAYNTTITGGNEAAIIAVDGNGTGSPGRVRITLPTLPSGVCLTGTPRIPLN